MGERNAISVAIHLLAVAIRRAISRTSCLCCDNVYGQGESCFCRYFLNMCMQIRRSEQAGLLFYNSKIYNSYWHDEIFKFLNRDSRMKIHGTTFVNFVFRKYFKSVCRYTFFVEENFLASRGYIYNSL